MPQSDPSRACEALLGLMLDNDLWIGQRIEAAEGLLSYEAPTEMVEAAQVFLTAVFESPEVGVDHRLKALKLARKCEAPKAPPPPSQEGSVKRARDLAVARRRVQLMQTSMWPPPPGWRDDLDAMDFEPAATGTVADPAQALNAARLRRKSQRDPR